MRLGPLLRQELAQQPRRWQLVLWLAEAGTAWLSAALIPQLAPEVLAFLGRALLLPTPADVARLGAYVGCYAFAFWLVAFELLRILVIPAEEGYLGLFWSKPLTRGQYLLARLLPVWGSGAGLLLALMLVSAGASAWLSIGSTPVAFSWGGFLTGAGISAGLGWAMALLAALGFVRLRETSAAVAMAFVCWLLPVLPASLLIYRPELFVDRPWLRAWIAFPANLVWLHDGVLGLAWLAMPLLGLLAMLLLGLLMRSLEGLTPE